MFKDILREIAVNIKYNSRKENLLYAAGFVMLIATSVLSGDYYPFYFFILTVLFWVSMISASRPGDEWICEYMTPLSDGERKKQYIFRMVVYSALMTLIMFAGNISAMIFGGHNKIKKCFICILLLHIILFLTVLNFSFSQHNEKKLTGRFSEAVNYLGAGAVGLVSLSLLREDGSSGLFFINMDLTTDFSVTAIAITELVTAAVQLIIFIFKTRGPLLYEYSKEPGKVSSIMGRGKNESYNKS